MWFLALSDTIRAKKAAENIQNNTLASSYAQTSRPKSFTLQPLLLGSDDLVYQ